MKKIHLLLPVLLLFFGFGKAQTPSLVYDIYPGSDAGLPDQFAVFNGKLYFQADEGVNGLELWEYDGVNNPSIVADMQTGGAFASSMPQALTPFNGSLYFTADNGTDGYELWKYDGSSAPFMIADLYPGFFYGVSAINRQMIVYKNNLYFQGNDGTAGGELYKYDGVSSSPVIAADINSGATGSLPASFAIYNDTLYFVADDGTNGTELWKFDGTTASLAADIVSGSGSSAPAELTVFNGKLYFTANDGVNGTELWVYDDVTQTASMVADINSGSGNGFSLIGSFTEYNSILYFAADNGIDGAELWRYDGTNAPSMVEDIYPGLFNSSFPSNFIVYDGVLYFAASDATNGQELRKYTGSGSAQLVYDLNPGTDGAFITGPIVFNNGLYFGGDNGFSNNGHELWTLSTFCVPTFNTQNVTDCFPYFWTQTGETYFSDTTVYDTLSITNGAGCDSIMVLNLTIPTATYATDVVDVCDSYTWRDGITYTASNNTASYAIQGAAGCDSLVYYLDLTIRNGSTATDTQVACDSLVWIDGNTYYTNNTTATVTYTAANGCDSIIMLDLTINNSTIVTDTQVACDSLTWIDGNTYYTNNNTATQTLTASNGCDSIVQLDLTINSAQFASVTETVCASYISPSGQVWDVTGIYADTLMTTAGCDSIITVDLTVLQPSSATIQDTACNSYVSPSGQIFDFTSIFSDTIPNSVGCDSVITIELFMKDPDVSTTLACNTLTANETGATYQWINCDNGNTAIAGATNQEFTPGDDGNYAVIVTKNGCTDTSSCTSITLFRILGENSDFVENPNVPFVGVQYSRIGFADVDGDQDQDVLIMGVKLPFEFCNLYINDGDGNFTEKTGMPFNGIGFGGFDFADVDGDQDMDIIINGSNSNNDRVTQLYLNDGSGNYTLSSGTSFIDLDNSTVNFADVDGDLDQDVLMTGDTTNDPNDGATTLLYINNGTGNFTLKSNTPFLPVTMADVAFADVDGDQDMDVLITGENDGLARSTTLYVNDGSGNFTIKNTPFIQVAGEVAFADVDGDQDQDVFISGREGYLSSHPMYTNLYINDGSGNYTLQSGTPFSAVTVASLSVADVDGDQDQDLLITGEDDSNLNTPGIAELYLNDGNGTYTLKDSTPFFGIINGDAAFADVNGDQKIDLLISGNEETALNFTAGTTRLYMAYNSASTNGNILVANPISPVDSYQWIDCNTGEPIPGATDSIFIATVSGSYAVTVTSENCVNTSECYTVSGATGVEALIDIPSVEVYPNPSKGIFIFESSSPIASIQVTDINGRLVGQENPSAAQSATLNLTDIDAGVYFFKLVDQDGNMSRGKIIKQ